MTTNERKTTAKVSGHILWTKQYKLNKIISENWINTKNGHEGPRRNSGKTKRITLEGMKLMVNIWTLIVIV